ADGADAKHRIRSRRLSALITNIAKASKGHLAIADADNDEGRHLGAEIGQRAREVDGLVEEFVLGDGWCIRANLRYEDCGEAGTTEGRPKQAQSPSLSQVSSLHHSVSAAGRKRKASQQLTSAARSYPPGAAYPP